MARGLSNPTVEVNDVVIGIVPNSLSTKRGFGDRNVRAQSAGGNSVESVVTENAETKLSMVKFSIYNTQDNQDLLDAWLRSSSTGSSGNTVRVSEAGQVEAYVNMVIPTEPERPRGADAEIEIEFMGNPAA